METSDQLERFRDFFESYKDRIHETIARGGKSILFDFKELLTHDPELADLLLEDPENLLKAAEISLDNLDLPSNFLKIRFNNIPLTNTLRIRDIRSVHLDKFVAIEGLVRQTSDVRPQVTSAKFECPSCGNTMQLLQIDTQFREPSRCSCGRRGKFRLIHKDLIDAQRVVVEEAPESLEGGEQPKRLAVFLKGDLVEPKMEKRTTPGTKVRITGMVKEVEIPLRTGGQSTRYDLIMESNFIEPIEETFEEINITKKEEEEILELSKDPRIYQRLVSSVAPSIYGHEDIKAALILQLMGGVQKMHDDGTKRRGDMHVLLIGDPGCIAGDSQVALIYKGMEKIQDLGQEHLQPIKEFVTKIRKNGHDKYYDYATVFQHYPKQPILKVITETGKEIICTYNQPLLTKHGWKRADEIKTDTEIRVMPKIPSMVKKLAQTNFVNVKKTYGKLKEVTLPDKVTPELASLYGYILGDGNIHPGGYRISCYINNEEADLIDKISLLWKKTFNVEPTLITKEKEEEKIIDDGNGLLRSFISRQKMHILEVNSRQLAFNLSFLTNKTVPQEIFRSSLHVVAPFISWLFEADGCVFGSLERGRSSIQLKSSTPKLLKDVQLLLLYFGIHSRIIRDNLCIRRSHDMELFIKHIGFVSNKKKNKLENLSEIIKKKNEVQKRKKFQRWERISGIIPFGVMDVYDFEVPKSHTFVANGIVCHNSGKSQMLQFISKIAPKARLVSGKGASAAGLTATVTKDEFLRGWALEAGAFVLANGGLCIIDEMDKINQEDTSALHQALEQQIITIAKANIQACYSSDTEVLTEEGWKKYTEVKKLKMAQFNPNDQSIKFIPHKGLSVYDYEGEMYQFKNKRNDIVVTPNHKMLAREYRHKKYNIYDAKDLTYNYIQFLNSGNFIGSKDNYFFLPAIKHKQNRKDPKYTHQNKVKKIKMGLWLEFLGYYLSEGGIQKKPTIGISQKPGDNLRKIKKCLSSMAKCVGFTLSETKDGIYTRFQITNTQLFEFLEKHCGEICKEKKYPLNFSSLSVEQLKILYDAMMLGDGCSKGKYFSSTSKDLIDLFQAIALLVGKSANKSLHYKGKDRGNREDCYRVSLSDKTKPTIRKKKIKTINYKGKVFCFSTSTGFFVTRRNGKIAIQGNTLKAQTTLLAAANPKLGRFDPYLPIASQINMPSTLINRFDLIFPIRDIPSREFDTRVATHVLMLQQKPEDIKAEFSPEFLKKYISYARQKIKPALTKEAVEEIKSFYVNLRNLPSLSEQELKPIPISARQLEALVRLSEGSARVRLSKKVMKKDAQMAIETLKRCLMQVGFDPESGQIDIDRISTGLTTSKRSKIVKVQVLINELTKKIGKRIPVDDLILEASEQGIDEAQVNEALDILKRDGTIYQPQPNIIEKI